MIVFDLRCPSGHVFEAWFASSEDWESQRQRQLVSCPICDDVEVSKAVMAPAVGAKGNRRDSSKSIAVSTAEDPARVKTMMAALAKAQAELIRNADYVGSRFAEEARAIHLGEADHRQIYGETTREEAMALIDEGIAVSPLPLPLATKRSDA